METHPRLGYELASSAPSLREALPVILHHHERVDGGGYPEGLKGRAVPLEARVVAVADVWDALTSDRAYRTGWDPARALAHIVAGRSTHFDPAVVDVFLALAADWGITLPARAGRGRGGLERGPDLPRGRARGRAASTRDGTLRGGPSVDMGGALVAELCRQRGQKLS